MFSSLKYIDFKTFQFLPAFISYSTSTLVYGNLKSAGSQICELMILFDRTDVVALFQFMNH